MLHNVYQPIVFYYVLYIAVDNFSVSVVFEQKGLIPHVTITFYVSSFILYYVIYVQDYSPQPPNICAEFEVSATYILELKNSSGHIVQKTTAEDSQRVVIEERLTLEAFDSYTVNVTVFVPSYAGLGSYTNITGFGAAA